MKLKNKSVEVVYDPRHIEKIYIPHDNGMDFETCILLEPSQQYKGDFLEEIVFQHQLRNELEEVERTNQIQLTVNTDATMEEIIKKAVKNKKESFNQPTSKKAKIASIRDNKDVEKQLNRETDKFDLSPKKVSEETEVIDFTTKERIDDTPPKKSPSRLMQKLKKKRDEEFGKNK
ncbi:Mu transposase C-terminal domain-containing protein [Oceanobacillus kapialis]